MLEFQNVNIYRKKRKIVDNFNLKLEDGEIFGLLGSDQDAKSAILQAAAGSIKPSYGEVLLEGEPVFSSDTAYLRIGYMPRTYGFYEQLTVEEYFAVFLALYKVNGRYRSRRVDEVLNLLEMEEYRSSYISEIPGELKPFLCLGKTILHEPSWLIFDEPFSTLTPAYRKKMLDCLGMLWEQGKTLVINTPVFPEINAFLTDVAVIEGGQVVAKGTIETCYESFLRSSPIRMRILEGMDEAIRVLRENELVDRVTVNGEDVILLFSGGDREEAQLLTQLVEAGAKVHHYMRDPLELDEIMWR
ncbi:MAG: ABC transporter ATP-binding protein [Eubacterium sp.]|nr:ABC transporter ATP-binding protein [Eubacterium sp.]